MDAAAGLAILLREKAEEFAVATFSDACVEIAPRRGFALRDAIVGSQAPSGTYLKRALSELHEKPEWRALRKAAAELPHSKGSSCLRRCGHRPEKFCVGLRFREATEQKLHGFDS